MISISVPVDVDFSEPVSAVGMYNLAEAAIDRQEPLLVFGCKYNGKTIGPVYLVPDKDEQTGVITLSSFSATIGTDDMLTPVGYTPPDTNQSG